MLNITKNEQAIRFEFSDSIVYPYDGIIEAPLNLIYIIVDNDSELISFKNITNNDLFFPSVLINGITIDGAAVTKDSIIDSFATIGFDNGGGSAGAVSSVNGMTGDVVLTAASLGAATTIQLNQEISDRTAADSNLQLQIDTINTEIDNLDTVIMDINDELSELQSDLTQEISDRTAADTALNTKIDTINTEINNTISDINTSITSIEEDITNIQSDITSINTTITNIQSEIDDIDLSDYYNKEEVDTKIDSIEVIEEDPIFNEWLSSTEIAIGLDSNVYESNGVAIGNNATTNTGVSIGNNAIDNGGGVAVGNGANGSYGVAIGRDAIAIYGLAIGSDANSAFGSIAIGNYGTTSGMNGIAIGNSTSVGLDSIAIGREINLTNEQAIVIGNGADVYVDRCVAIGNESEVVEDDIIDNDMVVSIGNSNEGEQRRIINVKDGINKNDAVNVGQLSTATKLTINNTTLIVANWVNNNGIYEYTISDAAITTNNIVEVSPANDTYDAWLNLKMLPQGDIANGSYKMYAKAAPTVNVNITYIISNINN